MNAATPTHRRNLVAATAPSMARASSGATAGVLRGEKFYACLAAEAALSMRGRRRAR